MLWLHIHSSLIKHALYSQSFTKTSDSYTCLFLSEKQITLADMHSKLVTYLQANFSHTTSLSHNHHCLNVSRVFIVSVTALFWWILYLFINICETMVQNTLQFKQWKTEKVRRKVYFRHLTLRRECNREMCTALNLSSSILSQKRESTGSC